MSAADRTFHLRRWHSPAPLARLASLCSFSHELGLSRCLLCDVPECEQRRNGEQQQNRTHQVQAMPRDEQKIDREAPEQYHRRGQGRTEPSILARRKTRAGEKERQEHWAEVVSEHVRSRQQGS